MKTLTFYSKSLFRYRSDNSFAACVHHRRRWCRHGGSDPSRSLHVRSSDPTEWSSSRNGSDIHFMLLCKLLSIRRRYSLPRTVRHRRHRSMLSDRRRRRRSSRRRRRRNNNGRGRGRFRGGFALRFFDRSQPQSPPANRSWLPPEPSHLLRRRSNRLTE